MPLAAPGSMQVLQLHLVDCLNNVMNIFGSKYRIIASYLHTYLYIDAVMRTCMT